MSTTTTVLDAPKSNSTISLNVSDSNVVEPYKYEHLLPYFSQDKYPPLTPFKHEDPGLRALQHENPRSFLDRATSLVDLTPNLGTEVTGVNLATLDSDAKDQLALAVGRLMYLAVLICCRWLNEAFWYSKTSRNLSTKAPIFILLLDVISVGKSASVSLELSSSRSLHIHPTSGHPKGYPEIHLVYK